MGTKSTVKFVDEKENVVLSVYNHYDGYMEGVGADLAKTLKNWVVVGVTESKHNAILGKDITKTEVANGILDLALLYVMDNKGGAMNMYVTNPNDKQEFNYVVSYVRDLGYTVDVYNYDELIYSDTLEEFIKHVESLTGDKL